MKTVFRSEEIAHIWAHRGAPYGRSPGNLSFDGCGINGRDEYRTRLCTFTEKRGEDANHYGPLFAAAPEMFEACREALAYVNSQPDAPKGSIAEVAQFGVRHILKSALSLAQSKP